MPDFNAQFSGPAILYPSDCVDTTIPAAKFSNAERALVDARRRLRFVWLDRFAPGWQDRPLAKAPF